MVWLSSSLLWTPAIVGVAYYVGCLAGFALRFPASGISFFWPPTAVLAAALILTAPRSWAALLVVAFGAHAVAHAQDGVPIAAWPIQFVGNAVQAALAAVIVRRLGDGRLFADARHALIFLAGACAIAPAVASLIPAYVYVRLGWATDFWQAWVARTVGNAIASLTLLPSLLIAIRWWSTAKRAPPRLGEYLVLLVGTLAALVLAGSIQRTDVLGLTAALYAPTPFLLWAVVRFGGGGLSFMLLWTTLLTIVHASAGSGPFGGGRAFDTVAGVQLLIAANAVPMILIAGLLEEVHRDMTRRWQSERALREAQDALIRTGRIAAMSQFSASIAHELRQPLTAITANALACLRSIEERRPAEMAAALRDIVASSEQASHIAERTQEMFTNRPQEKREVNVNDAVRKIVEIVGARLRERRVRLDLDLADDLPPVSADAVQIQQVLLNLIVNGVDAMEDTAEPVRVLRIESRRRGRSVVVSVRDRGKGFGAQHPARVFEPFYTTKAAGIGMGLTICRSIVRTHDGSLWAVANADRGATFRFKLPVLEARPKPPAGAAGRRVLIVDDHDEMRRSIGRLLRTQGHRVATAADGRSALAVARLFRPDYAIVDLSLRDVPVLDLARQLRTVSPAGLQVVALTARQDDDVRDSCLRGGFDRFFVKPGGIVELEQMLAAQSETGSVGSTHTQQSAPSRNSTPVT